MRKAFTIIRVSAQDQLKGYGPEVQWEDDILLNAPSLGLETPVEYKRIIQEPATGWDRELFEATVREGLALYHKGEVEAMLFPRVDRETRFVVGSLGLLSEVLRNGMSVFFARGKLLLDPNDPESVERYLSKAIQAQAYVVTMRENTMRAIRKRAEKGMMPTGGSKWAYDYHHYRNYQVPDASSGRYTVCPQRAAWLCKLKDWILIDGLNLKKCEKEFEELTGIKLNRATLWRILTDPIVIGKVYAYRHKLIRDSQGRKRRIPVSEEEWLLIYEDPNLAIFTEEEYHALKRRLQLNKENSDRNTQHHYPPLKAVVCQPCNLKMQRLTTNFGTAYYRCPSCRNHINAWKLWEEMRDYLASLVVAPENLIAIIKADIDGGQTTANLERKLADNRQRMEMLGQAETKALRLHLYLPDYPIEKLEAERGRIEQQRQQLAQEKANLETQIAELRQARIDEEGIRHFCQIAGTNLEKMDDKQWQMLLEALHLRIMVVDKTAFVEGVIPISNDSIALQPAHR